MLSYHPSSTDRPLEKVTSALAITATFSKGFVPFQFFGSNFLFSVSLVLCIYCIFLNADRNINRIASLGRELVPIGASLVLMTVSYIFFSGADVPITYLIGIVGFWCVFFCLGILCTDVRSALSVIIVFSAIYLVFVVGFFLDNGEMYVGGYFGDVFGIGGLDLSSGASTIQLYQNVGYFISIGAISFWMLSKDIYPQRPFTAAAIVTVVALVVDFAVQARGAVIALLGATVLFVGVIPLKRFWIPLCVVSASLATVAVFIWGFFSREFATPEILAKTFDELAQGRTDGRLFLFGAAIDQIITDGGTFLFGRGLGMFPIDMGYRPPDWLFAANAVSMYPHNIVIEAQYELGILGTFLIVYMILRPVAVFRSSLWDYDTKIIACLYVFFVVLSMFSGSLAYSYVFLFVLGMFWGRLYASKNWD